SVLGIRDGSPVVPSQANPAERDVSPKADREGSPASSAAAARRRFTAQLGSSVLIFGLSVPLAFVNTAAAMWFWLTLIPAHYILGHHPRRLPQQ
ncbi:hypothetical protein ABZV45_41145, partial [Streptomyces sp. NPDC005077]